MSAIRQTWRMHGLYAVLAMALAGLAAQLYLFQSRAGAEMSRRAIRQQRRTVPLRARRGNIYANGRAVPVLLASSRQVPSVFADPTFMPADQLDEICLKLSGLLHRPAGEFRERFDACRREGRRFLWLAREAPKEFVDRVGELDLPGIGVQMEWRRYYPNDTLAAHVLGFANFEGRGVEGIERYADEFLRPHDGRMVIYRDAARRAIDDDPSGYIAPVDGHHIQLTLDVAIQGFLEDALARAVEQYKAESAVGVVVDPGTGEVLALANVPTFDPNLYNKADADERRNRVLTDPYEPGSIFKCFIAAVALATGDAAMGETFDCESGAWRCRRGRTLHDAHGYDDLTFEQVVQKSSNIGMAKIGQRMGNRKLFDVVSAFGFGQPTGIPLNAEQAGQVNPLDRWTQDSMWSIPMGQEISVTAIQMAIGFAALANDGMLLRPKLVRSIMSPDGRVIDLSEPEPVALVIPPSVARQFVREVLAGVPTTEGTGRRAQLDGWTSFGKTGTAQIPPYNSGRFTASYVAGAPVEHPRLVCLISVRDPDRSIGHYGGTVAGPAVKEVLERSLAYLDVPRDRPDVFAHGAAAR